MEHGYVSSSHPSQPQCPHGLICHAVNGPGFPFEETAPCDLRSGHEARSERIDPSVQGHVPGFKGTQSLSVCLFVIDINYRKCKNVYRSINRPSPINRQPRQP
ncbi:predicted protein [Aspergillus terreus NIH2624]|uniref:Uncharacterized protein n=1 Tax=Aspergillus terreus (strain NIH 2624 / FGSC A1156) TaxID=341663 RepID=Q0CTW6_ASPTN|nr:uncharacterized protein ATEG_02868 [Aspergillus terreus NIH2624]EAU36142.1 predicted protein [Aspergillus terreus NIH2624]